VHDHAIVLSPHLGCKRAVRPRLRISGGTITLTGEGQSVPSELNRSVTSSRGANGLGKGWDGQQLMGDVQAQVTITQNALPRVASEIGTQMGQRAQDLRTQANQTDDPSQKQALLDEAAKYDEGGTYRVAAHTALGALGGGLEGAAGAAAASSAAPTLNELQGITEDANLRNDDPITADFFTYLATFEAKLCWYKGIEVQIDDPRVPMDLMPISLTHLQADGAVTLDAARNTSEQHSTNAGSSGSIGVGFMVGGQQNGFTINASASTMRGHADGSDTTWTNTHVSGQQVQIDSGGDTTLKGAVVQAEQVSGHIGGNLNIQSLQDSSTYDAQQKSSGAGVSLCIPPICYGSSSVSVSLSNAKAWCNYANANAGGGVREGAPPSLC
jgi:hypothetical protein